MNEIIISQCSAETISISTGGIQGDVIPAVGGSAYEELMLSLQYCMEYILGGGGGWIVFFGTVNGTGVLASSTTNSNPSCAPRRIYNTVVVYRPHTALCKMLV